MGTVHTRTVAVHFRYDCYMRRLVNEFLDRNPISAILYQSSSDGFGWTGGNMHITLQYTQQCQDWLPLLLNAPGFNNNNQSQMKAEPSVCLDSYVHNLHTYFLVHDLALNQVPPAPRSHTVYCSLAH